MKNCSKPAVAACYPMATRGWRAGQFGNPERFQGVGMPAGDVRTVLRLGRVSEAPGPRHIESGQYISLLQNKVGAGAPDLTLRYPEAKCLQPAMWKAISSRPTRYGTL